MKSDLEIIKNEIHKRRMKVKELGILRNGK